MRAILSLALFLSACGSDGDPAGAPWNNGARESSGDTIDGEPAPPKRTPDRLPAIPDPFRGDWAAGGTDCGPLSDGRLTVAADELRFYESVARPTYILREDDQAIALELAFSGEGESWTETTTLRILPDGRLSRRDPNGTEVLYSRCPVSRGRAQ